MIMQNFSKEEILNKLLSVSKLKTVITVQGNSMEPTLYAGDKVTIKKGIYFPGDILVFKQDDNLIIHRLLGWWIKQNKIIIVAKGDNSNNINLISSRKLVLGKVLFWKRETETYKEFFFQKILRLFINIRRYIASRF